MICVCGHTDLAHEEDSGPCTLCQCFGCVNETELIFSQEDKSEWSEILKAKGKKNYVKGSNKRRQKLD